MIPFPRFVGNQQTSNFLDTMWIAADYLVSWEIEFKDPIWMMKLRRYHNGYILLCCSKPVSERSGMETPLILPARAIRSHQRPAMTNVSDPDSSKKKTFG